MIKFLSANWTRSRLLAKSFLSNLGLNVDAVLSMLLVTLLSEYGEEVANDMSSLKTSSGPFDDKSFKF